MPTAVSIIGLTLAVALEIIRATSLIGSVPPALLLAFGLAGSICVTIGAWNLPRQTWRMWIGLAGLLALFSLLLPTYMVAARMLSEPFPLMSEGIVAAPILLLWFGVVAWRVSRSGTRGAPRG